MVRPCAGIRLPCRAMFRNASAFRPCHMTVHWRVLLFRFLVRAKDISHIVVPPIWVPIGDGPKAPSGKLGSVLRFHWNVRLCKRFTFSVTYPLYASIITQISALSRGFGKIFYYNFLSDAKGAPREGTPCGACRGQLVVETCSSRVTAAPVRRVSFHLPYSLREVR